MSADAAARPTGRRATAWLKPLIWGLALTPLIGLVWLTSSDGLGPNPQEALIRATGDWALRGLCVALAVTPLRVWSGWNPLARVRRLVGLFAAFYAALHALAYAVFDMGWDLSAVAADLLKRPFILVGFAALLLLAALAATSSAGAVRRLGPRRWQALHRSVYGVAALALLHFFWMRSGKRDYAEVAVYAAVLAVLLGWRLVRKIQSK